MPSRIAALLTSSFCRPSDWKAASSTSTPPAMIGRRSLDRVGRLMSSMCRARSSSSRSCGRAWAVIAPLLSFIAAQISLIALWVPDEPSASSQPSARYLAANGWNSALISVSASFQRFLLSLPPGKKRRVLAMQPACRLSRSSGCMPLPMMNSVEPPPMSITSRRWPGLGGCAWATPR